MSAEDATGEGGAYECGVRCVQVQPAAGGSAQAVGGGEALSIKFMNAVWDCDGLTDDRKFKVMLALADWTNEEGICWPAMETLARKSRMSIRSAQMTVRELQDDGLLEVVIRRGRKMTNLFKINLQAVQVYESGKPAKKPAEKGAEKGANPEEKTRKPEPEKVQNGSEKVQCYKEAQSDEPPKAEPPQRQEVPEPPRSEPKISLSDCERELCIVDLRRIFPAIHDLPDAIPTTRAFTFWYKVRTGEIAPDSIKSPVAYMAKMLDEDVSVILKRDGERVSRMLTAVAKHSLMQGGP